MTRRAQADRSAATRAALVDAARALFAAHGYGAVGTEAIAGAAGVTRGALYHQFAGKRELFEAVVEAVEQEVITGLGELVAGVEEPLAALEAGAEAWFELCRRPEVHRIVLLDAPAVLGWERWREIGVRYGLGLVEGLLANGMATGAIAPQPTRPLAHLLIGAIDEGALYVARAADPDAAQAEVQAAVRTLIGALRPSA